MNTGEPALALRNALEFLQDGHFDSAEQLLLELQSRFPAHTEVVAEANYLLGISALSSGRAQQGLAYTLAAARAMPADARIAFAVGRGFKACGQIEHAVVAYQRAIALQPSFAQAHVSLGIAYKLAGQLEQAIACHKQAIALQPDMASAHANLANAQAALAERLSQANADAAHDLSALPAAQRACALAPDNPTLHFNCGLMLLAAGRRNEAIGAFDRALGLDPANLAYCLRLGQELKRHGAAKAAIAVYEGWLRSYPENAAVCRALAGLLTDCGSLRDAVLSAERAVALDPGAKSYLQLCRTYQQCRRLSEALAAGLRALELSNHDPDYFSTVLLVANYVMSDPRPLRALHADFGHATRARPAPLRESTPRDAIKAGRRLKVAYLSADFIDHSVSYFIGHLLERHDPSRFEIWCLYNRGFGDVVTEHFKSLGHHWVECAHLSDDALYQSIRSAGIDVLIDLAGHTAGERLRLLAMAPAPLQITYLGYPNVTGLSTVDARITDAVIDPPQEPLADGDPPLRLPRSMLCYRPGGAPPIGPLPCLAKGHVTFGSFNNVAKLGDECLSLWAQVLRAVPGSRLLLKSSTGGDGNLVLQGIADLLATHGIDAGRIEIRPRVDDPLQHLAAYNEVDVALDSFPYNGATTTCEALWMGVPVVSMRGQTRASRMGASLLNAAGRSEWCVDSASAFVATAASIAGDEALRSHWRENARAALQASQLMDIGGFVRDFESAIEFAWQSMPARS